jgi:hypothetical protein
VISLLALLAFTTGADPASALASAADDLAARACAGSEPGTVALAVEASTAAGLRDPLETALAAALARRGFTPVPLRGADAAEAEKAARALAADILLRVRAALSAEGLSLAAEAIPTRPNFFLQRVPGASAGGARLSAVTVPAGPSLRALAAAARPTGALSLVPLSTLDERVLALGAGAAERGATRIAAVTPTRVLLLDAEGEVLSTFTIHPAPPGPRVRDRAATVAVGDFGAGRVAFSVAGTSGGEVLSTTGDQLAAAGTLSATPLASGAAGRLFGAFLPGRGILSGTVSRDPDPRGPGSPPDSAPSRAARQDAPPRGLLAVAAAPRAGKVAYGLLGDDYGLRLLGPDLSPSAPDVAGVGAGFALADVDGDGEAEVVASSAAPGPLDRVRVLRPGAAAATAYTSAPVEGAFLAGAGADLTGDGIDDAVLAAILPDGRTRLWLLTTDARGGAR